MTFIKSEKQFDRIWTIAAGSLSVFALILTAIALRTSSWTINEYSTDAEVQWHGLFWQCNRLKCIDISNHYFDVIFTTILGAIILLFSAIFIFLMGVHRFPRRHFYITPSVSFVTAIMLMIALILYAQKSVLNGVSARLMMTAVVLAFMSLAMIMFVAGRYSIHYQKNPTDFYYTKAETNEINGGINSNETIKKDEEIQQHPADI